MPNEGARREAFIARANEAIGRIIPGARIQHNPANIDEHGRMLADKRMSFVQADGSRVNLTQAQARQLQTDLEKAGIKKGAAVISPAGDNFRVSIPLNGETRLRDLVVDPTHAQANLKDLAEKHGLQITENGRISDINSPSGYRNDPKPGSLEAFRRDAEKQGYHGVVQDAQRVQTGPNSWSHEPPTIDQAALRQRVGETPALGNRIEGLNKPAYQGRGYSDDPRFAGKADAPHGEAGGNRIKTGEVLPPIGGEAPVAKGRFAGVEPPREGLATPQVHGVAPHGSGHGNGDPHAGKGSPHAQAPVVKTKPLVHFHK